MTFASLGASGIDELRWLKPVAAWRPLSGTPQRGRDPTVHQHPAAGSSTCVGEMFTQGERVLLIRWSAMIARGTEAASLESLAKPLAPRMLRRSPCQAATTSEDLRGASRLASRRPEA